MYDVILIRNGEHWIGLRDEDTESIFRWINYSPLSYDVALRSDQPNGDNGQNCIVADFQDWEDRSCNEKYKYICSNKSTLPSYR